MRDARLSELAILTDLENTDQKTFSIVDGLPELQYYGLGKLGFRQMLIHCILEGYVNGPAELFTATHDTVEGQLRNSIRRDVVSIFDRNRVTFKINHKGRLRLWALKDELLSKRHLDPMQILLSSVHRERDLEIAFRFLPVGRPLSLIFCDMDHFKGVNDTLGHEAGDAVMKTYLQIVRDSSKGLGEAYRGVGDEVTVVLPEIDGEKCKIIAEELRTKVEEAFRGKEELAKLPNSPTVSIGAATFTATMDSAEALKLVDALMYAAKKAGKNRKEWKTYPEPSAPVPAPAAPSSTR